MEKIFGSEFTETEEKREKARAARAEKRSRASRVQTAWRPLREKIWIRNLEDCDFEISKFRNLKKFSSQNFLHSLKYTPDFLAIFHGKTDKTTVKIRKKIFRNGYISQSSRDIKKIKPPLDSPYPKILYMVIAKESKKIHFYVEILRN